MPRKGSKSGYLEGSDILRRTRRLRSISPQVHFGAVLSLYCMSAIYEICSQTLAMQIDSWNTRNDRLLRFRGHKYTIKIISNVLLSFEIPRHMPKRNYSAYLHMRSDGYMAVCLESADNVKEVLVFYVMPMTRACVQNAKKKEVFLYARSAFSTRTLSQALRGILFRDVLGKILQIAEVSLGELYAAKTPSALQSLLRYFNKSRFTYIAQPSSTSHIRPYHVSGVLDMYLHDAMNTGIYRMEALWEPGSGLCLYCCFFSRRNRDKWVGMVVKKHPTRNLYVAQIRSRAKTFKSAQELLRISEFRRRLLFDRKAQARVDVEHAKISVRHSDEVPILAMRNEEIQKVRKVIGIHYPCDEVDRLLSIMDSISFNPLKGMVFDSVSRVDTLWFLKQKERLMEIFSEEFPGTY